MRFSATKAGLAVSAVAAAAFGIVLFCVSGHGAPNAGAAQQPAMSVPVVSVVTRTVPVWLDYVGTTEAIRSVTLQAQVTGYLAARGAPDGADVNEGQLLYKIDPRDYQAALNQIKAQTRRDSAAYDYSLVSQRRNSVLSKDGWVAKDTSDQTTSNLNQSEATLAADAAAIQTAELKLGYTEIRAPFPGRIGKSLVHEGALINATGTQLNTLVELDPIYATFNPSESELAAIVKSRSKGPVPAEVQVANDPDQRFSGTLLIPRQRGRSRHRDDHGARDHQQSGPCTAAGAVRSRACSHRRPARRAAGSSGRAGFGPTRQVPLRHWQGWQGRATRCLGGCQPGRHGGHRQGSVRRRPDHHRQSAKDRGGSPGAAGIVEVTARVADLNDEFDYAGVGIEILTLSALLVDDLEIDDAGRIDHGNRRRE